MSDPTPLSPSECLPISPATIARAAKMLRGGKLVAFPTETVYGLGADACNADAVAAIFAAKQRPSFNPLISHVADQDAAFALGEKTRIAEILAAAFWPGPLTLILRRQPDCPLARLTSAGLDLIALRVPAHEGARALLQSFGGPIAAPSANPSGQISPSRAQHVLDGLDGRVGLVLDGGRCDNGVESTVVDCSGETAIILRPGGITRTDIITAFLRAGLPADTLGTNPAKTPDASQNQGQMASPGQLESHYAPRANLLTNISKAHPAMVLIGFAAIDGHNNDNLPDNPGRLNLSPSGDLREAAANLFDMLHIADATGTSTIGVAPIPNEGLGEAINDRLQRAAAPRPSSGPFADFL